MGFWGREETGSRLDERLVRGTLRAVGRVVRDGGDVEEGDALHAEILGLAADDDADADRRCAGGGDDVEDFANGTARRHDVFDDDDAIVRVEGEAATERRDAVFFFDEDGFRSELTREFVTEHDPADGGADDDRRRERAEPFGEIARDGFDERGIFEDAKFLDEAITVSARGESEVTFE